VRRDVLIGACAISAGIHAALAPEHYDEVKAAGIAFALSAVVLAVLAVVLSRRRSHWAPAAAAAVFAGLIVAYLGAITTGVPVFHPEQEPVEALALFTKGVELAGLVAALGLLRRVPATRPVPLGLTALVAVFSGLAALGVSHHHDHAHDHSHAEVRTPSPGTQR
jgi:drug/metabolite transporter (DMT)-like permease